MVVAVDGDVDVAVAVACTWSAVGVSAAKVKQSTKRLLILICIWQNALADGANVKLKIQSIK